MEKELVRKTINLKALDVDTSNRKVKVALAELETIDRSGEVWDNTAFDKSISERGPKGANEIWHMADHGGGKNGRWLSLEKALSKYEELGREGKYINGVAPYRETWLWREVTWPLYEAGDINQHSIGAIVSTKHIEKKGNYKILKQGIMMEGSTVLVGDNPNTPTHFVMKSILQDKEEGAADRIDWICKAIKEGKYSGENESLLILELKELGSLYTVPEPSRQDTLVDEPEEKPLIKSLNTKGILSFIEIQKQLLTN